MKKCLLNLMRFLMWPFENRKDYLILEAGEVPSPEDQRSGFGQRHGSAILHHGGKPYAAENVRLSDGTLGCAWITGASGSPPWRRPVDNVDHAWQRDSAAFPVRWSWGRLLIEPDEITFKDDPSALNYSFTAEQEPFYHELLSNQNIRKLVLEIEGCVALWVAMTNSYCARGPNRDDVYWSPNDVGDLVAAIRGLGEVSSDIQSLRSLLEPLHYAAKLQRVQGFLLDMGWRWV
ncbi:hypothetical protein KX729_33330 [Rhizobium sp. XQZ8]|uniref:hypothetical protein n=1 Tax=Rhizobium populisoli TaxID=2859785 RepID=UPI001CA56614|nr:hypothetical protein [Rhizobium populisoli]MBW6426221.1 hypothetical protein [Rhizobium populisoli]